MKKPETKIIAEFLALLAPYKKKVLLAFIAILFFNLLTLAFPWVIKIVIDEVLVRKDFRLLNLLTAALLLIFILKFYSGYLREYLFSFIGENVVCDLRRNLYWHLQKLSVRYVENNPMGKIISGIIGDVESVKTFLFGGVIDFVYSFFNLFFVLVVLFVLDWQLALVSLVFLPVLGLTYLKLSPRLKEKHDSIRTKYAELTSRLNEVLNGIRVVTGFARNDYEAQKFNLNQREIFEASMGTHRLGILLWMSAEFISSLGLVAIIWFGALRVFSGRMTVGTLMAFYSYLGMLFFPVIKMVIINNYYQEAAVSLGRINKILSEEPAVTNVKQPIVPKEIRGHIVFKDVCFSYDNKKEILTDINLDVLPSTVVAIAGKSGSGKTTLINLLLRFYEPTRGAIFIDGHNLKELDINAYRSRIAMVIQDDYLFGASICENILYSRPEASRQDVERAARLANAHPFILELPDGYDTQIGERGIKLSYGQRQRVSIARAILRDPAILILDEATSNVDSETERRIIEEAFIHLMAGRTTFIITHRLQAINFCDRIAFIENGRVVEFGNHQELLARKGNYWRMWGQQRLTVP